MFDLSCFGWTESIIMSLKEEQEEAQREIGIETLKVDVLQSDCKVFLEVVGQGC